jgi:hypothetical protein
MTRKEMQEKPLGPDSIYPNIGWEATIPLPKTRAEFEAIVSRLCARAGFEPDDLARQVIIADIHHIKNEIHETTLEQMYRTLHKSVSNHLTWEISEENRKKIEAENLKNNPQKLTAVPPPNDAV